MEFRYEVTAKVETLHLDGATRYVLQGRISFHVDGEESAGEPLNLALVFPEDAWKNVAVGETLTFLSADFFTLGDAEKNDLSWFYNNQIVKREKEASES